MPTFITTLESLTGRCTNATAIETNGNAFRYYLSINVDVCDWVCFIAFPTAHCALSNQTPLLKPAKAKLQRQIVKDGSRIKCKSNQSGWNPSLLKKSSQWGWREKGLENRWSSSRNTKSHPARSEWLILLYQCAISRLKSQNYCAEARIKGC